MPLRVSSVALAKITGQLSKDSPAGIPGALMRLPLGARKPPRAALNAGVGKAAGRSRQPMPALPKYGCLTKDAGPGAWTKKQPGIPLTVASRGPCASNHVPERPGCNTRVRCLTSARRMRSSFRSRLGVLWPWSCLTSSVASLLVVQGSVAGATISISVNGAPGDVLQRFWLTLGQQPRISRPPARHSD